MVPAVVVPPVVAVVRRAVAVRPVAAADLPGAAVLLVVVARLPGARPGRRQVAQLVAALVRRRVVQPDHVVRRRVATAQAGPERSVGPMPIRIPPVAPRASAASRSRGVKPFGSC